MKTSIIGIVGISMVLKQAEEFNNRLIDEQGIDDPERFLKRE